MEDTQLFQTKDLAEAFEAGMRQAIEMNDDNDIWVNSPLQITSGEWQVGFGSGY